jgi:hypothetical protein
MPWPRCPPIASSWVLICSGKAYLKNNHASLALGELINTESAVARDLCRSHGTIAGLAQTRVARSQSLSTCQLALWILFFGWWRTFSHLDFTRSTGAANTGKPADFR